MAMRPQKKHKEHARKALTDARKQEIFARLVREAQIAGRESLIAPDADDRAAMVDDDAADALPAPARGRIGRAIQRLARFVRS